MRKLIALFFILPTVFAFCAEALVNAKNNNVIVLMPDGHKWGVGELDTNLFQIIRIRLPTNAVMVGTQTRRIKRILRNTGIVSYPFMDTNGFERIEIRWRDGKRTNETKLVQFENTNVVRRVNRRHSNR